MSSSMCFRGRSEWRHSKWRRCNGSETIWPGARVLAAMLLVSSALTSAADLRPVVTGACFTHTVSRGETLRAIGSRYGVDPATILIDNTCLANRGAQSGDGTSHRQSSSRFRRAPTRARL